MKKLAIFVPIYNEERIVERNLRKILSEAKRQGLDIILYAVDDSSKDTTSKILKNLEKKFPALRYIRYENGPSRRENLAKAMALATEPYLMFMDLDLATDLKNLRRIYDYLERGEDVATGSRYCTNSKVRRGLFRLFVSRIYNLFMRIYFRSRLKDHQCGFKGFRRDAFQEMTKIAGYDSKKWRGWFWDAEMMIIAQKKGYKIVEFGIEWDEGKQSSFNLWRELRMVPYVLMLPLKLMRIKPKKA